MNLFMFWWRTKLKQTEVDCEYLKRCCETLTEENRRLHKELQELRALKTSNPFNMQLPATTLTMCPSCERVATNSTATSSVTNTSATINGNNSNKINQWWFHLKNQHWNWLYSELLEIDLVLYIGNFMRGWSIGFLFFLV